MKKIITLLFSFGALSASFAQFNHGQNSRSDQYVYNQRDHFDKGKYSAVWEKNFQIEKINREFNFKIQAIKANRHLRRREKKAAIRYAELERSRKIQMVSERFDKGHYKKYDDPNNRWNR